MYKQRSTIITQCAGCWAAAEEGGRESVIWRSLANWWPEWWFAAWRCYRARLWPSLAAASQRWSRSRVVCQPPLTTSPAAPVLYRRASLLVVPFYIPALLSFARRPFSYPGRALERPNTPPTWAHRNWTRQIWTCITPMKGSREIATEREPFYWRSSCIVPLLCTARSRLSSLSDHRLNSFAQLRLGGCSFCCASIAGLWRRPGSNAFVPTLPRFYIFLDNWNQIAIVWMTPAIVVNLKS